MELRKITQEELNEILEKHEKWLNGEGGERADLSHVNLRYANLEDADLRFANLLNADLGYANLTGAILRCTDFKGADLDFSCFPLCCGGLYIHIDERQAFQLLYHLLRNVSYSMNISEDVKQKLLTPELVKLANRFHRAEECGEIAAYKDFK